MRKPLLCLLVSLGLLIVQNALCANGIESAYASALADLNTLQPELKPRVAYFWLGDVKEAERIEFIKVFSGHVASLSRFPKALIPQVVAKDLSLIRVDAQKQGWSFDVRKRLVLADPYGFKRLVLSTKWHGGVWYGDGKHYAANSFDVEYLVPVIPARFMIWQSAIQRKRDPGYYDFLDVKDRAAFDKLVGFNRKVFEDAQRSEFLEAVAFSGVANQPRRMGFFPALDMRKYATFDNEVAVDAKDPLEILDDRFKHEAEELFGALPNGMLVWFLSDDKGVRQDSAPDFVGKDSMSPTNDGRIHCYLSCAGCHYNKGMGGKDGIVDFKQNFRTLLSKMTLVSPDHPALDEIERKYMVPIDGVMNLDRKYHSDKAREATGMDVNEWAAKLRKIYYDYNAGVPASEAALYLGMEEKAMVQTLKEYSLRTAKLPLGLGAFVVGDLIPRDNYHKSFPVLRSILKGVKK